MLKLRSGHATVALSGVFKLPMDLIFKLLSIAGAQLSPYNLLPAATSLYAVVLGQVMVPSVLLPYPAGVCRVRSLDCSDCMRVFLTVFAVWR